jgi:competence protein ComEA
MLDFLKTYFYSNRNERIGFKVIVISLFAFIIFTFIFQYYASKKANIQILSQSDTSYLDSTSNNDNYAVTNLPSESQLFEFNPNTVSKSELIALGINERTATTFGKLQSKGFKFYKKEDIKKVYGFTSSDYIRLERFIVLDEKTNKFPTYDSKNEVSNVVQPKFFPFDPNTTTDSDFKILGLSEKAITSLRNYQAKGGTFYNNEKFLSNYSIPQPLKDSLVNYINIKKENLYKKKDTLALNSTPKVEIKVDLNRVTVEELDKIKWMSTPAAQRIIKYRESLGGFSNLGQLKEVWGIHDTFIAKFQNYLYLSSVYSKIHINECVIDSIPRHPYIDKYRFRSVLLYRNNHGKFNDPSDLLKTKIYTKEEVDKLTPYLKF